MNKKFAIGYMPNTDFKFEELEGLLASYYLTYLHFQESTNKEKVEGFKKLLEALTKIAEKFNVQTPQQATENVRAEQEWAKPHRFPSYFSAKDCLNSFQRDFGVSEPLEEIKKVIELVSSELFLFHRR